jgi:hypothetical protein
MDVFIIASTNAEEARANLFSKTMLPLLAHFKYHSFLNFTLTVIEKGYCTRHN